MYDFFLKRHFFWRGGRFRLVEDGENVAFVRVYRVVAINILAVVMSLYEQRVAVEFPLPDHGPCRLALVVGADDGHQALA